MGRRTAPQNLKRILLKFVFNFGDYMLFDLILM